MVAHNRGEKTLLHVLETEQECLIVSIFASWVGQLVL